MTRQPCLTKLEAFARRRLAASRYPNDLHVFTVHRCDACGVAPFELTVEHHTGSKQGRFRGVVTGRCASCGEARCLLSFTGQHRQPLREERPSCSCGSHEFYTAECERFERDEGLPGFFDEGVVVGQCAHCGRQRTLAHTD